MATLPPARTGWLAALHDPIVGRALMLLHASPAGSWTVASLARRVATSRTVLGERFAALLGRPPMRYLAQWRLQLAAHYLRTTGETLPEIAGRVGYESEAAFSRAFKRELGVLDFRRQQVPVLISDLRRRSLQVHIRPPIAMKAI